MTSLGDFCARFDIDPGTAEKALAAIPDDEPLWYVQLVLGIGAWITAIAGLLFVGFLVDELFDIEESGLAVAVLGAGLFALACWFISRKSRGEFTTQIAVAAGVCGAGLGVLGIGMETESMPVAAIASVPFAIAAILIGRSALLQFLLSGLVVGMIELWIIDSSESMLIDLASLTLPAGLFLSLRPPRWNLTPTAMALFLAFPLTIAATYYFQYGSYPSHHWPARIVCVLSLAALAVINARGDGATMSQRPAMALIAALAVLVAILLPPGLSATLVIMYMGYSLGRRSLAIIGALLFAYFLWSFYADLQQTLMVKSVLLMSAGAAMLIIRSLLGNRPMEKAVKT